MADHPSRATLNRRAAALPLVESGEVIDTKEINAVLLDVERLGSMLPEHLRDQAAAVLLFAQAELEHSEDGSIYVMDEQILKGLIARAVRAGAAQTVSDLGQPLVEQHELEEILLISNPIPGDSSAA